MLGVPREKGELGLVPLIRSISASPTPHSEDLRATATRGALPIHLRCLGSGHPPSSEVATSSNDTSSPSRQKLLRAPVHEYA